MGVGGLRLMLRVSSPGAEQGDQAPSGYSVNRAWDLNGSLESNCILANGMRGFAKCVKKQSENTY
jgi:hypothetical protein